MPVTNTTYLDACHGRPSAHTPVWFMRQAGRSLPEYRAVRGPGDILQAIAQPDVVAEITLQPVRRYAVDAAILYSDIMTPAAAIGFGVEIQPGVGPVVANPFRSADDLNRLRPLEPANDTAHVIDAIQLIVADLTVPLIGFAGAPFTLAAYLVEGGPSKTYAHTKAMMHSNPQLWFSLADRLADMSLASLRSQVEAGCSAVQLFDSWAGALSAADYRRYVLPFSAKIFAGLSDLGVPRSHFGVGTGELLALLAEAGADVVGVDWRVPLDEARRRLGPAPALQGNLDPAICLAPWDVVEKQAARVLSEGGGRGHIFNLGHGVLPQTDPDTLKRLVDFVHQRGAIE